MACIALAGVYLGFSQEPAAPPQAPASKGKLPKQFTPPKAEVESPKPVIMEPTIIGDPLGKVLGNSKGAGTGGGMGSTTPPSSNTPHVPSEAEEPKPQQPPAVPQESAEPTRAPPPSPQLPHVPQDDGGPWTPPPTQKDGEANTPGPPNGSLGWASFPIIGIIISAAVLGASFIFGPSRTLTSVAFAVLGIPVWWWAYQKLSANHDLGGFDLQWCESYVLPFSAASIIWFAADMLRLRFIKTRPRQTYESGYKAIDAGVPHARYTATRDGCVVQLYNAAPMSAWVAFVTVMGYLAMAAWFISDDRRHLGLATIFFPNTDLNALLVMGTLVCFIFYLILVRAPTRIEFTPEAIVLDAVQLRRSELKSFVLGEKAPTGKDSSTFTRRLCYVYGGRTFEFGGHYSSEPKALDVATALNRVLRETASSNPGIQQQPSPEELRNARPSDF